MTIGDTLQGIRQGNILAAQQRSDAEAAFAKQRADLAKQAMENIKNFEGQYLDLVHGAVQKASLSGMPVNPQAIQAQLENVIQGFAPVYRNAFETFGGSYMEGPNDWTAKLRLMGQNVLTPQEAGKAEGIQKGSATSAEAAIPGSELGFQRTMSEGNLAVSQGNLAVNQMNAQTSAANAATNRRLADLQDARDAFAQEQPNSPEGKLVRDYVSLEETLGADNPITTEFREAVTNTLTAGPEGGPKITDVAGLRKEYTAASSETAAMSGHFRKVQAAAQNPGAAGDVAMIFAFMKMLDPESVVREGEQAQAANAAGVPERIRNLYNRLLTGEKLSPKQRDEFLAQSSAQLKASMDAQRGRADAFTRLAVQQGMRPEDVVWDVTGGLTEQMTAKPETKPAELPQKMSGAGGAPPADSSVPQGFTRLGGGL